MHGVELRTVFTCALRLMSMSVSELLLVDVLTCNCLIVLLLLLLQLVIDDTTGTSGNITFAAVLLARV